MSYGTDKETYRRGENVTAFITIKNNGDTPIRDALLKVSVAKQMPLLGYTGVYSTDYPLSLDIPPGESKKLQGTSPIPLDFHGISTRGKYEFTIEVLVQGERVADIKRRVTVV